MTKFRVHIYGDFNLPGIDWLANYNLITSDVTSLKASSLFDFIYFNGFEQRNTIQNSAGNVLDLVLVSTPINYISPITDPLTRVDHFHPPFAVSFCFPLRKQALCSYEYLLYSSGDYLNMYKYFQCYDWKPILNNKCADSAAEALTEVVSSAINDFVPKRVSRLNKYPAWFSKELRSCLRRKLH